MSFLGVCNLLVRFRRLFQARTKHKQEMRHNRAARRDNDLRAGVKVVASAADATRQRHHLLRRGADGCAELIYCIRADLLQLAGA